MVGHAKWLDVKFCASKEIWTCMENVRMFHEFWWMFHPKPLPCEENPPENISYGVSHTTCTCVYIYIYMWAAPTHMGLTCAAQVLVQFEWSSKACVASLRTSLRLVQSPMSSSLWSRFLSRIYYIPVYNVYLYSVFLKNMAITYYNLMFHWIFHCGKWRLEIVSKKTISRSRQKEQPSRTKLYSFIPFCTGLSPQRRASPSPPPKVASKVVPWQSSVSEKKLRSRWWLSNLMLYFDVDPFLLISHSDIYGIGSGSLLFSEAYHCANFWREWSILWVFQKKLLSTKWCLVISLPLLLELFLAPTSDSFMLKLENWGRQISTITATFKALDGNNITTAHAARGTKFEKFWWRKLEILMAYTPRLKICKAHGLAQKWRV